MSSINCFLKITQQYNDSGGKKEYLGWSTNEVLPNCSSYTYALVILKYRNSHPHTMLLFLLSHCVLCCLSHFPQRLIWWPPSYPLFYVQNCTLIFQIFFSYFLSLNIGYFGASHVFYFSNNIFLVIFIFLDHLKQFQ